MQVQTYPDPPAFLRGLTALQKSGLTPRKLLFLALDSRGAIHLGLPADVAGQTLRVGEKLALRWPGPPDERLFHFDSLHILRDDFYVFNGDRRLAYPGDAVDVGLVLANFLKWNHTPNVFFGCTPHQPGSWLVGGKEVAVLHDLGVVEVLPVPLGLLARRVHDHRLYLLTYEDIARTGHLEDWLPVYSATLGNILLLERRVVRNLLVLSCERGLVEIDLTHLPRVRERALLRFTPAKGQSSKRVCAVVGRVDRESFAVTSGTPRPWGLENLQPAELVGAPAGELREMSTLLLPPPDTTS